ncbi:MAG TPA: hypothetical protein VF796_01735 [Humisphaera sp.]
MPAVPDRLFTVLSAASLVAWFASAVVVALVAADMIAFPYGPWPLPVSATRVGFVFLFGLWLPALWVVNLVWIRVAARRHRPGGFPVVVTEPTPASPPAPAGSSRSGRADSGS